MGLGWSSTSPGEMRREAGSREERERRGRGGNALETGWDLSWL